MEIVKAYIAYLVYIVIIAIILFLAYKFLTSVLKKYLLVKQEQIAAIREQNEALKEIVSSFNAPQSKE